MNPRKPYVLQDLGNLALRSALSEVESALKRAGFEQESRPAEPAEAVARFNRTALGYHIHAAVFLNETNLVYQVYYSVPAHWGSKRGEIIYTELSKAVCKDFGDPLSVNRLSDRPQSKNVLEQEICPIYIDTRWEMDGVEARCQFGCGSISVGVTDLALKPDQPVRRPIRQVEAEGRE